MRVSTDEWGAVRIRLEEHVGSDFAERLLAELLAFARPHGRGAIAAEQTRDLSVDEMVAEGIRAASLDMNGMRHGNGLLCFDYVAGHRVKVLFHPAGLKDLQGRPVEGDKGFPVVVSREFDLMYGPGALENAVRLALL